MLPNLYYVHKYARLPYDPVGLFIKPLLATAGMGAVIWGLRELLPSSRVITVLLVLAGIAAFAFFALLTGAMTKDDLKPLTRRMRRRKTAVPTDTISNP